MIFQWKDITLIKNYKGATVNSSFTFYALCWLKKEIPHQKKKRTNRNDLTPNPIIEVSKHI